MRLAGITVRMWATRLGFAIGRRRSVRARVVLATAHADTIGGNLAAIAGHLARVHPTIEVVTLTTFPRRTLRGRIAVLWQAVRAGHLLATSRLFVVDDYFLPVYAIRPRRGTTIVQAWHACGAFKRFGYSVLDKTFGADEALTRHIRIHANYDVCLVSSSAVVPHFGDAFRQPPERFRSDLGIPRTDVLFGDERIARTVADLRRRYAIPEGRRVVLYAPTFRGDNAAAARFSDTLDLRRMHDALGADHVVLVRLHPFIRAAAPIPSDLRSFAIDVSDHPDINELLLVADILVTDYSSVIFEYALLGRPMVFFAPDLEAYERERGFYFAYATGVPGPIVATTDELVAHLRGGRDDLARVARFRDTWFDVADGRATERFVDAIVLPAVRGTVPRA